MTAALVSTAVAQPRPAVPELVGASEVIRFAGTTGFIDDAVAFDDQRVAYVVSDGSSRSELHLVTLATEQDTTIDLSAITLHPIALRLLGARAFVVGQAEDGSEPATLFGLAPGVKRPVVYRPAATHVTPIMRDGRERVAVYRCDADADGTRHDV